MKKIINFHKIYPITAVVSLVLILIGIIGYALFGFNMGVDFSAGIVKQVQFASPALELTYNGNTEAGNGEAKCTVSDNTLSIVYSGAEVINQTLNYSFNEYKTIGELTEALKKAPNIDVVVKADLSIQTSKLVPSFEENLRLSKEPRYIRRVALTQEEASVTAEDLRQLFVSLPNTSIQQIGDIKNQLFSIRVDASNLKDGADQFTKISETIMNTLTAKYTAEKVVSVQTDNRAAPFAQSMVQSSIWVVFITLIAIAVYATIRFRFNFALGVVIAIMHDAFMMVMFIVITRIEFNVTSIAAILTILGYSCNDTIVIFDRVRETRRLNPDKKFYEVLNQANTETLGRTFITFFSTFLCAISLFLFTTGQMKDFALVLMVGMVSGTYSTIFIACQVAEVIDNISEKRKHKKAHVEKLIAVKNRK